MKILKLASYYTPEQISSTHLSKDLNDAYLKEGFTFDVYAPTPTRGISGEVRKKYKKIKYEELDNGQTTVHRFSMFREGKNPIGRAIRYFLVNVKHYFKGIKAKDIDLISSGSTPPTQGLLCAMVKKKLSKKYGKKVSFVYTLQDVFPDSLVTTGLAKKGGLLWKIGRKIEDYTYRNADAIIVISEGIKKNIMGKGVPEEKITVISNWIDTEEVKPIPKTENVLYEEFGISRDKFTVVYAGNVGKAQGAGVILDAAKLLYDRQDLQFVIFGAGASFDTMKARVNDEGINNVIINPILPPDRVSEVYSLGDIALITCKKGVGGSGLPSKTWSIMGCNTPIIATFDTASDLANVLREANAGACVEPENPCVLADAILTSLESPIQNCGAREYVEKYASKEICTAKYIGLVKATVKK